ncbi:hypothetical protein T31B1_07218 [Salinisphaera sp. T31B1]
MPIPGPEPTLKILAFINWILLGIGALMALLYAVVCLMMWPYPELVENAGGGFGHVVQITCLLGLFTATAALATWLLEKRHRRWWWGQILLAGVFVTVAVFAWTTR